MNEELIKILLEKFDKLDNKIDVMIPKQATIEERVNFLIKKVDEQEKRMKENDKERDYIKSIVRFDNLQSALDSDIPFEKKTTIT
jgi:negative regulator of genetic competence, sporulation and motility